MNINLDVLKKNVGDDDSLMKEIIEAFLEHYPKYLNDLEKAIINQDTEQIKQLVHKMKSSLRLFGVYKTAEVGDNIEYSIKENIEEGLFKKISNFAKVSGSVINELKQL